MSTFNFTSLSAAARKIASDAKARQKRVEKAVLQAAKDTAHVVAKDIAPKAFGDLSHSIHAESIGPGFADVVADAPHAAAVEVGSRPHMPPLEPIIAWVRLRGIQGTTVKGNVIRNPNIRGMARGAQYLGGKRAAASIGTMLQKQFNGDSSKLAAWRSSAKTAQGTVGGGRSQGRRAFNFSGATSHSSVAPEVMAVAKEIQLAIAKGGTKPFHYMRAGITSAMVFLDGYVREALEDP